ncbi:MAG: site-specific DNA-methyltransferase [Chitinivibrionales bacterium]|nr:site-specific DNA-methyltransferase [Chitinivibrionales bacterium]
MNKTRTSAFGTSKREAHDASAFYGRNLYCGFCAKEIAQKELKTAIPVVGAWTNTIQCHSSTDMQVIPANSIGLAFTSPPYNVGKEYDDDFDLHSYLDLIGATAREVYRVLRPGARYVINIANLGRKPYIPLHSFFYDIHTGLDFLPMGEIIWQKAAGAGGNCAWGSWQSAKSPRLRDVHEYLLVFAKQSYSRPDKGVSDISRDEFMAGTLSIWNIPPASARRIGHPAPFPVDLAARVIKLYSYRRDVILDPYAGSGTTCLAAVQNNRRYVGFDISQQYCELARTRIAAATDKPAGG